MNPKINQEKKNHKKGNEKLDVEGTISRLYPFIARVFDVYEIQNSGDALYFYGTPKIGAENVEGELWLPFHQFGFRCTLKYELGEHFLLVAPEKKEKERIWINLVLFIATFFTTMICGAGMFGVDLGNEPLQLFRGLPFTLAIMAILGSHEMAHYINGQVPWDGGIPSLLYPDPHFYRHYGSSNSLQRTCPQPKSPFRCRDCRASGRVTGVYCSYFHRI